MKCVVCVLKMNGDDAGEGQGGSAARGEVDSFFWDVFGPLLATFPDEDFPKVIDAMRVFFYRMAPPRSESIAMSARQTARTLMVVWVSQNIPTLNEDAVTARIMSFYGKFCNLRKSYRRNKNKASAAFNKKVVDYKADLEAVLDISSGWKIAPTRAEKRKAISLVDTVQFGKMKKMTKMQEKNKGKSLCILSTT